jgi:amino acid transporter
VSPAGTGWVYIGATTRNVYGISVHGFLPKVFQRANSYGIPWVSALVASIIGVLVMYPAPSWYELVGIITGMTALTYIGGGIAVPLLRKHAPDLHRPFRLSWYWLWSPLSFLAAVLVVYWGGYATDVQLYAAVFLGSPIFAGRSGVPRRVGLHPGHGRYRHVSRAVRNRSRRSRLVGFRGLFHRAGSRHPVLLRGGLGACRGEGTPGREQQHVAHRRAASPAPGRLLRQVRPGGQARDRVPVRDVHRDGHRPVLLRLGAAYGYNTEALQEITRTAAGQKVSAASAGN